MNLELLRAFREKLNCAAVGGTFSKTEDPAMVEAMGYGGMDFLILDLEHGPNNIRSIQNLIRAAELSGIVPIVRVKERVWGNISEALDVGAYGVEVPQINSADDARLVLKYARYAPEGGRGVCRFVRAADYSTKDRFQYFKDAGEALIILQIEGEQGISAIEDILAVEGCADCIFIGPYDLSQSLGVPGQIDHPDVEARMRSIVSLCNAKGVAVGTFVDTPKNALKWKNAGVQYLAYSVDVGLMADKAREVMDLLAIK